jgi:hypothetical protein
MRKWRKKREKEKKIKNGEVKKIGDDEEKLNFIFFLY